MGLVSPGGVHSHQDHMAVLAQIVSGHGVPVAIHAFLDGRDVPPRSAIDDLPRFEAALRDLPDVQIATVAGRYYAMDRDRRWERTARAYDALVSARGRPAADATAAVKESYANDIGDEFVEPAAIAGYQGAADGDGLIMANFRADRARQIMTALLDPAFDGFARDRRVRFAAASGMSSYSESLDRLAETMFPPQQVADSLGAVVSRAGLRQLRIAETEKYAHVTFFLNGGEEREMPGEERVLVPLAKGGHLRPAARDVGAGSHRPCDRGYRGRPLRPDRRELRQRRHGGAHRRPERGDGSRRRGGPVPRPPRGCG